MRRAPANSRGHLRRLALPLALLTVLLVSSFTVGSLVSTAPARGAPLGLHSSVAGHAAPPVRAPVHPSAISCTNYPPESFAVAASYDLAYPFPSYGHQTPCLILDGASGQPFHDEIHATYSSAVAGSALRWTIPVTLPDDIAPGTQSLYTDFYVGEVVTGDPNSWDRQSYFQIAFTPDLRINSYYAVARLLSLHGNVSPSSCQGQSLTWNGNYSCEYDLFNASNGTPIAAGLNGGVPIQVTFVGSQLVGTSLTVYVNDSAQAISASITLNTTTTGIGPFRPAFSAACPDQCILNWTFPFGIGFGADLCYYGGCSSYSQSALNATTPATIGPALFYTGGAYTGEYRILAPESASGACSLAKNQQGNPVVVPCPTGPIYGYYPVLSFNGTELNLGTEYSYTTEDFGGAQREFQAVGGLTDDIPFWLDQLVNSSRAGFLDPGATLNVTVRAQVLGTVPSGAVYLWYTLPNGSVDNLSMNRWGGGPSNAHYSLTIPGSGGNGIISYRVWATDTAGATIADPSPYERALTVQRTGIPRFTVHFSVNAGDCGGILYNGTLFQNNTFGTFLAGNYSIQAVECYPWVFGYFASTRGITTPNNYAGFSLLTANGTVTGDWFYIRPNDTLTVQSSTGCGTIVVNGTSSSSTATLSLLDWKNYSISARPCSLFSFSGWSVSNAHNLSILGDVLTLKGNGTLTANFIGTSSSALLEFLTLPSTCGGVLLRGVGYTNNESVALATGTPYPIEQDPCAHYGFSSFTTTSGVTVSGGEITITNPGSVTENMYSLTELTLHTNPTFCGDILLDGKVYRDATVLNLSPNSTHSIYAQACAGYYFTGFLTTGAGVHLAGNNLTLNGSGTITAEFQKGTHPKEYVGFLTNPTDCGEVVFGSVPYFDSQYTNASPLTSWTVSAIACQGFGFVGWQTSGGITIWGSTAYVNGSGSIDAIFHNLAPLYLYTQPSGCGNITVNGRTFSNGAIVYLPINHAVPISAVACPGYGFAAWHNTSDALLGGGRVSLQGTSVVTAVFVLLHYAILFLVSPATCGGIQFGPEELFNNTTRFLTDGLYPIASQPCAGDFLESWNVTGELNVVGGNLSVGGAGTVMAVYGPTPPSLSLSAPVSTYANAAVEFVAAIAVPVPPYTYTYDWTFGDGTSATTPANFTSHQYAHPGLYHVHVLVHDPYGRIASANATVQVTTAPLLSGFTFTLIDGVLVGVVLAVLVAVVLASRWGRGGRTTTSSGTSIRSWSPPPSGEDGAAIPNVDDPDALPLDAPPAEPSNFEETV
ncbi:MAG TPA: PKD domain-containing protein [Thermoplasmata archaeon]|nr:PKD domain-containing protein [Thermoplasmata archaeon]